MKYVSRLYLLIPLLIIATGCASIKQQRINEAMLNAQLDAKDCGELSRETATSHSQCVGLAYRSNLQAAGYEFLPLLDMLIAKNNEAAASYEAEKLTYAEYAAIIQRNWAEFQYSESQQIALERQRQAAAWQAVSQNLQTQQMQNQMMLNNNRMRTTNCNQFGNTFNCYSY